MRDFRKHLEFIDRRSALKIDKNLITSLPPSKFTCVCGEFSLVIDLASGIPQLASFVADKNGKTSRDLFRDHVVPPPPRRATNFLIWG